MDTHITTTPDLDDQVDAAISKPGGPLSKPVGLPSARQARPHVDADQHLHGPDAPAPSESVLQDHREPLVARAPRQRGHRKALLFTTAAVVVCAGIGAAAWTQRAPLASSSIAATASTLWAHVAGRSASGPANAPSAANQPTPEIGIRADTTPARPTPSVLKAHEIKVALEKSEFASLKVLQDATPSPESPVTTGNKDAAAPALASAANPLSVPAPVLVAPPAAADPTVTTPGSVAIAEVGTSKPLPAPRAPASGKPREAVDTAIELRAEPMAPKQMVNTVAVVTELGAQLKEARYQVSQLTAAVAEMKELLDTRMIDFEGRLGLAEAGTVLAQSAKAGLSPASSGVRVPIAGHSAAAAGRSVSTPISAPVGTPSASPPKRTVKDFRIQGASPGLVVLNLLTPAPGEATVLYLALGDQVPGLGRLKAVQQRGTAWVAQTDAGLIQ